MTVWVAAAREVSVKTVLLSFVWVAVGHPGVALVVLAVDALWALVGDDRRTVHDHLARTRVVHEPVGGLG